MVFGFNGKFTLRRRQELASYTPARAGRETLEPTVGSYKPIMQKEEVLPLVRTQRTSLPDVLPERAWGTRGTRSKETSTPPSTHSTLRQSPPHTTVSLSFALEYKSPESSNEQRPPTVEPPNAADNAVEVADEIPSEDAPSPPSPVPLAQADDRDLGEEANESPPPPAPLETSPSHPVCRVPVSPRRRLPAEFQCERIRLEFLSRLPSDHRLNAALTLPADFKTASHYISGLFQVETTGDTSVERNEDSVEVKLVEIKENGQNSKEKEELRPKVMPSAPWDMKSEKKRLCQYEERLVDILRSQEEQLRSTVAENEAIVSRLATRMTPTSANKFKVHSAEIGQITALMAALASRLARTHNALSSGKENQQDKEVISKRDKLMEQLEEAKLLKENIDKRATSLSTLLSSELNEEDMNEYKHFIITKTKLLLDIRDLQDTVEIERQRLIILNETVCKR